MTEELDLTKRVEELDKSLSIALDINDKYQRENVVLKKRAQEAEEINKLHQELNGKLRTRLTEVEADNKILSKQISDHIKNKEDIISKAGLQ